MKEVTAMEIENAVFNLFLKANYIISDDIRQAIYSSLEAEVSDTAKAILSQILENYRIASEEGIAICQDSGMAILFAEIGQDVHINGDFYEAVNQGVRRAYKEGYLRASIVQDPLFHRINTGDNTPAVIHIDIVHGDNIKLTAVAKGFGSENTSRMKIFLPSNNISDIKDFVVETVKEAGANSCPPVIVGVGIGGTLEKAALLAKRATTRTIGCFNNNKQYAELEQDWLKAINEIGLGPAGFGGRTTALAVNIEHYSTHIASVPVVVNLCCHASRHAECIL